MERTTDRLEVYRELEIAASPETVWELLVDPDKAVRWWGQAVLIEAWPGGKLRIEVTPHSIVSGEVLEVDPPRRLVCSWGWELGGGGPELVPPGSSTVEIELLASGTGTRFRLVHRGLPDEGAAASHSAGWDHYLGRLTVAASGADPGPDPWRGAAPAADG